MNGVTAGNYNTSLGYKAFNTNNVNNSTALGASTTVTGNQAVGIGYLATASDNQIVLGTAGETVLCKGTNTTGSITTSGDIYINGIRAGNEPASNTSTAQQTCFGNGALLSSTTASNNTAFGFNALYATNKMTIQQLVLML